MYRVGGGKVSFCMMIGLFFLGGDLGLVPLRSLVTQNPDIDVDLLSLSPRGLRQGKGAWWGDRLPGGLGNCLLLPR